MSELHDENGKFKSGHKKIGGRKKGDLSLTEEFRKLLRQKDDKGHKFIETLARQMFAEMLKGNERYALALWEQIDGKAKQQVDIESQDGIDIRIKYTDANGD